MGRRHLFELEDQHWLPNQLRSLVTDLLQYQLTTFELYKPIIPHLKKVMQTTDCHQIVDLCSGGGGPLLQIQETLVKEGYPVSVTLTDKYPNLEAFRRIRQLSGNQIDFKAEPVEATNVSSELKGIRTLFTSFHHFQPEAAKKIIIDAVEKNAVIGIFEFTERRFYNVIGTILLTFLLVLFQTPFVRPFKWSRLFWTYVIPFSPFICFWDGMVSNFRTYSTVELQDMISDMKSETYTWEINQLKSKFGLHITYLIGHPAKSGQ
ncbi:MAG TPA: hypothetical protein ENI48_01285 [Thioploca sp.]|nr:hypothetical protein [Thioploca sp.]